MKFKLITPFAFLCVIGLLSNVFSASAAENTDSLNDISSKNVLEQSDSSASISHDIDSNGMEKTQFSNNIWRYNKKFMLGFTTGKLDRKNRFGGEISSRWGASLVGGRNIHFHRNPIAGFLKIGMNLDFEANYMNFEKGSGSFSDIINPDNYDDYENIPTLGEHYLTIGVAVGPTATFAPFYAFSNADLAALRFRPYFRITPSFASYIVSDEDDIEMHNAFALWYSAGLEIQWKRLIVGLGWKGSSAKYKGLVDDFLNEESSSESYKFDVNMFNILIGVAF